MTAALYRPSPYALAMEAPMEDFCSLSVPDSDWNSSSSCESGDSPSSQESPVSKESSCQRSFSSAERSPSGSISQYQDHFELKTEVLIEIFQKRATPVLNLEVLSPTVRVFSHKSQSSSDLLISPHSSNLGPRSPFSLRNLTPKFQSSSNLLVSPLSTNLKLQIPSAIQLLANQSQSRSNLLFSRRKSHLCLQVPSAVQVASPGSEPNLRLLLSQHSPNPVPKVPASAPATPLAATQREEEMGCSLFSCFTSRSNRVRYFTE